MKTEIVRLATREERMIIAPFADRAHRLYVEAQQAQQDLDAVQARLSGDNGLIFDPNTFAWLRPVVEEPEVE